MLVLMQHYLKKFILNKIHIMLFKNHFLYSFVRAIILQHTYINATTKKILQTKQIMKILQQIQQNVD